MKVTRLNVTPVKGTQLQARRSIDLHSNGVADDRRFYIVDALGLMCNGKKEGRLVQVAADYDRDTERLALRFPGGVEVAGVWTAGEAVNTSFYGRPVAGRVVVGPWSQALSSFIGQAVRLVAVDRLGDALDVHPVTVVAAASIDKLRLSRPGADCLDYRRFRMLLEFDGAAANEEDSWTGRDLRIGSAEVRIFGPVPRCVIVSQNPDTGTSDFETLKALEAYRGVRQAALATPTAHLADGGKILFGMYGQVTQPGRIAVADSVTMR